MIAVVSGGVGAARFLRALAGVVAPNDATAIVNTGDDVVLHGLHISPDIDTITYTLAGGIDPERGWGLRDETWTAMGALARYNDARPSGSSAAPTWFNLGDQDLATHLYRTARLAEGATLTEITAEIAIAWGVEQAIVPMTDDRVATFVTLSESGEEISFQEYFVQRHHDVAVAAVRFEGAATARPAPAALAALADAEVVVIAPSNPLVSIAPLRAVPGIEAALIARRESVVAVSPIVGGAALKGPADRMLAELGHEPSVVGVARLYAPIARALVIDPVDEHLASAVASAGIEPVITESVMSSPAVGHELARRTLATGRSAAGRA